MKRRKFGEEPTIGILKEHQAGLGARELFRKHSDRDVTYKWRPKYGGMHYMAGLYTAWSREWRLF